MIAALLAAFAVATGQPSALPSTPMVFGVFTATFNADGTFAVQGQGWPAFKGTWKAANGRVELSTPDAAGGCSTPATYAFTVDGTRVTLELVGEDCAVRRLILDRSSW